MKNPEPVHYDERARRTVDELIAAEARHIAQRKAQEQKQEQECECKDGMFPRAGLTDRRKFLFAAGSLAGAVSSSAWRSRPDRKRRPAPSISMCRRSNQGAGACGPGRRRLRLALAIRVGGALALPDRE